MPLAVRARARSTAVSPYEMELNEIVILFGSLGNCIYVSFVSLSYHACME